MTLATIAAAAGVSTATVSRVLNDKPGVRPSTREAVLRAAGDVDKESTASRWSSNLIAVLVPELSNPSFPQFAQELTQILYGAGYNAIICPASQGGSSEVAYLDVLLESDIGGIISVSGATADALASKAPYQRLNDAELPTVYINGAPDAVEAPFFCSSDADGVLVAVQHLRSLGHTRIGLATGQRRYHPTVAKIRAFTDLGFDEDDDVVTTEYTGEGGARAGRRLLTSGHTAIICGSDVMALGVLRDAARQGKRAPTDFSVIGYDDSPIMRLTDLTTVRQPVDAICEAAVQALLQLIEGEDVPNVEHAFSPDLTIRNTTGAP